MEPWHGDLVFFAEKEVEASRRIGEAFLSKVKPVPLGRTESLEVFALPARVSGGAPCLFAWYTQGREEGNLRFAEELDSVFQANEFLVFYRHKSNQLARRLTVHSLGNFASPPNEHFGEGFQVSTASSLLMYNALHLLEAVSQERALDCDVSYEITHHNPVSLKTPMHFLEVGDGPVQWKDAELCDAVAEVGVRLLGGAKGVVAPLTHCLGVSYRDHYALRCTRLSLQKRIAFGHIISTRSLPEMRLEDFQRGLERSFPPVEKILYKRLTGLAPLERRRLEGFCKKQGIVLAKYPSTRTSTLENKDSSTS